MHIDIWFAKCVKQDGSYTCVVFVLAILSFAKCVKLSNP